MTYRSIIIKGQTLVIFQNGLGHLLFKLLRVVLQWFWVHIWAFQSGVTSHSPKTRIDLTLDFCLPVRGVTSVAMATAGTDSSSPHDPN